MENSAFKGKLDVIFDGQSVTKDKKIKKKNLKKILVKFWQIFESERLII